MWEYIVGGFVAASVLPAVAQVGFRVFKSKTKGSAGERKVDGILRGFKRDGAQRFRDVLIRADGKTSQLDNILVSQHGIFVIEVKNYFGIIKGQKSSAIWEQDTLSDKKDSRTFYNPIWQNNGHIKALKQVLGKRYGNVKVHNIVAFSDNCVPPDIPGVVRFHELQDYLKFVMRGQPVLSQKDVAEISNIIGKSNIVSRKVRKEHVAYAQYTSGRLKEQERQQEVLRRAEKDRDMAQRVQMAYSARMQNARPMEKTAGSLEGQILTAQKNTVPKRMKDERDVRGER